MIKRSRALTRQQNSQTKPVAGSGPESPTTARPLDLDDDDVQESGVLTVDDGVHHPTATGAPASASLAAATAAPGGAEEAPPPKPPRPVSEQQKNEQILKEAFPSIDMVVIKAVLTASGGRIDPAFNALLGSWGLFYINMHYLHAVHACRAFMLAPCNEIMSG